eukprot:1188252-Amphidinium_carterae.1
MFVTRVSPGANFDGHGQPQLSKTQNRRHLWNALAELAAKRSITIAISCISSIRDGGHDAILNPLQICIVARYSMCSDIERVKSLRLRDSSST